jgi:hypothetical protein
MKIKIISHQIFLFFLAAGFKETNGNSILEKDSIFNEFTQIEITFFSFEKNSFNLTSFPQQL